MQYTIRINQEYLEKLSWLAAREHRSVNRQIEWALEQYLLGYEAAHGPIPRPARPNP